jgi:hypothetical protein
MAYTPGYSGLLNAAMPRLNQWSVSKGRRVPSQIVQGLLQADLDKSKQFSMMENTRNKQLNMEQQRIDILKEQQEAQEMAGMVGGVGQIAQLPLAYGAGKSMGWWGGAKTAGTAGAGAQAAVAPAVASTGAQTAAYGVPMAGAAPYSATPALSYGVAGEVGGGVGATSAGSAGSTGLLGTAGPYAGPAGAGLLGGMAGHYLADKISPIGGEKEKRIGGSIVGGAAAGAYMGSVVPGVGTLVGGVIGGIVGGISSLF